MDRIEPAECMLFGEVAGGRFELRGQLHQPERLVESFPLGLRCQVGP
jgi:hypothetical protein